MTTTPKNFSLFDSTFHWGISTSAYQIEGGHDLDNKQPSIWDVFSAKRGKIFNNDNGNNACNFLKHYKSDIRLMKSLGIKNFRHSLSWPRIISDINGTINYKGIDIYNRIIDECLENNIEPWLTCYHWDLPQYIEDTRGWANRDILNYFSHYINVCAKNFGDRVKNWMVLNEPLVFTGAGYFLGIHAPGHRDFRFFLKAAHHAALSQSIGSHILKNEVKNSMVGSTFSCSYITPYSFTNHDENAALRADALLNRFFIEAAMGKGYPVEHLEFMKKIYNYVLPGDEQLLKAQFDFVGIQNYTREVIKHTCWIPLIRARIIPANKRKVAHTAMNWEIYPESIYHMLKQFNSICDGLPLIITENGAAFDDKFEDGKIIDDYRIHYLQRNIEQIHRAKTEGVNILGCFIWSLFDNFEWEKGFKPRFGIVHVDFDTHLRTAKKSALWYRDFLANQNNSITVRS